LKYLSKSLTEGGSRLRENDKCMDGRKKEEIPAFAGIELNQNESKPLYNKSPLIPGRLEHPQAQEITFEAYLRHK